jgi:hypothetical protein
MPADLKGRVSATVGVLREADKGHVRRRFMVRTFRLLAQPHHRPSRRLSMRKGEREPTFAAHNSNVSGTDMLAS